MQYEPIKKALGRFFRGPLFMRKLLYFSLDTVLLRTWHVRKVLNKIKKYLPDNAYILDAGSGLGQYTWRMTRINRKWQIEALDINSEVIDDCKVFFGKTGLSDRVTFDTFDLTLLDRNNCYNLILSVDVMEHIREDEVVFNNFFRSLKEGGFLIISTPSDLGGSDAHSDEDASFIDEHVRNGYNKTEIGEKLKKSGFGKIEAEYTYGIPGSISWKLSMKLPVKMLNASHLFFLLLPFYYIIVLPFSLLLNALDVILPNSKGTGLIITARKT